MRVGVNLSGLGVSHARIRFDFSRVKQRVCGVYSPSLFRDVVAINFCWMGKEEGTLQLRAWVCEGDRLHTRYVVLLLLFLLLLLLLLPQSLSYIL